MLQTFTLRRLFLQVAFLSFLFSLSFNVVRGQQTLYVDSSIVNPGNGSSWSTAFQNLTTALNIANSGTGNYTIHIAQGTYLPTSVGGNIATSRDSSFAIFRKGISILGGYPAGGGVRNSKQYVTRLSGNIGTVGVNTDNLYHVLILAINTNTSDSLIIDGVNIEGGYGNGSGSATINGVPFIRSTGGGVYINNSGSSTINKVLLKDCLVQNNTVSSDGGGMENYNCTLTIVGCCFNNNISGGYGGGLNNEAGGSLNLFNDVFTNNANPNGFGGGLRVSGSSTNQVINCTFTNNNGSSGGAIRVASLGTATVNIHNCIFRGNHSGSSYTSTESDVSNGATLFIDTSCLQSTQTCTGCLAANTDPLFTDINNPLGADGFFGTADDGLTLTNASPCVNTGNAGIAALYDITTDIVGSSRNQGTNIDMGAYENGPIVSAVTNGSFGIVYLCSGVQTNQNSFNVSGSALVGDIIVTPPTGFVISTTSNSGYSSSVITLTQSNGIVLSTPIYVRANTSLTTATSGNISITSTNAVNQSLPISAIVGSGTSTSTTIINCTGTYTWALNNQTYTTSGTYTAFSGCHTDTLQLTIMSTSLIDTVHVAACVSYTWNLTGQTYTNSGYYSYSPNVCTTHYLDLTINPLPPVFAGNDTAICIGHSISLHGSGANNYTWDFFVNNGVAFNPNITRTYTVTGTDGNGCVNTDQIKVTVNSLPVVSAGMDTAVCSGQYAVLRGFGSNSTYTWNNGVTNLVPFIPSATQTYTVTGTDNNGCSSTDQVVVTVKPLPNVYGGNDTIICAGTNLSLVPSGAVTYTWTYSYGNNNWSPIAGGTSTLNIAPNATVTYLLEGLGSNGCSNSDQVLITVRPLPTNSIDTIGSKSCFDANGNLFTLNGTSSAGTPTWSIVSNPNALNITWYTGQNVDSPVIKILGGTGGSVVFKYRVTSNQTPNCGVSEKSIAVKVIPIPTVNSIGNLSICNGTPVAAATFSSPQDSAANPVTYTWSNIAPPTGLNGQNIAGNLPGYTAINTSDILIYDAIKVTPTISLNGGNLVCQGTETLVRTVEVKPLPRAVLNNPNDTIQCNGSQLTLNIQPFVASQYTWTTSGDNVGLGSTIGSNPIPTFTATNIGNNTLTGNIVITPASVNGCSGVPLYFNVVVKPTPHLTNLPSKDSLCSGSTFTFTPTTNVSGTTVAWQRVGPNGINDTSSGINNIQETLSSHNALSYNAAQYNVHLNAAGCTNDTAIRVVVKPIPTKPTFTLPNDFCHNTSYINLQADRAPFANEHFIWSTEPDSALFQSQQRAMIKFALGQNIIHLQSEIIGSGCKTEAYTDTFNNTPTPFVDPYIIKKEYLVNDILHHIVLVCLHNPVQNYHWGRTNATTLVEDTQVYAAEKGQELYFKNPQDFDTANYYYWVKIVTDTENNCFRQIYYNGPFVSKSENVIVATNTPTSMKVYPNPAQTNVAVELTGKVEGNYQIKIQDVIGQVIQSFEMTDKKQQVDIQSLPSGYYLISCWQQGVHIATNKLIKN